MKYLEDEKLTEITAQLTDAVVRQSHRIINGRIEAYTMKRAGSDKKFAHQLGQKYVAEMEYMEKELAIAVDRSKRHQSKRAKSVSLSPSRTKLVPPATIGAVPTSAVPVPTSTKMNTKSSAKMSTDASTITNTSTSTNTNTNTRTDSRTSTPRSAPASRSSAKSSSTSTLALAPTNGKAAKNRKRSASAVTWNEAAAGAADSSQSILDQKNTKKTSRRRSRSFDNTTGAPGPKTSLGNFSQLATRKLMTDLILTLQSSFPDYDFSYVTPNQFSKLQYRVVRANIDRQLNEFASSKASNFLMDMWSAIDNVIALADCDVYAFEEEELKIDGLWTFNYFFVNKSLKRVLFFTCQEKIDEESQNALMEEQITFSMPDVQVVDDFDWDPSADVAGGIPISIA